MAKVTLPTGTHTLTKAQALALVATTSNSAIITGLGPLTIRWNRASGNTGLIDGVDFLLDVIPPPLSVQSGLRRGT